MPIAARPKTKNASKKFSFEIIDAVTANKVRVLLKRIFAGTSNVAATTDAKERKAIKT